MMYPLLSLDDGTEIVHSEMKPDGRVKVYMERPDIKEGFYTTTCWLPEYQWENISGFSKSEVEHLQEVVESVAHLFLQFSQEGGFEHSMKISSLPLTIRGRKDTMKPTESIGMRIKL